MKRNESRILIRSPFKYVKNSRKRKRNRCNDLAFSRKLIAFADQGGLTIFIRARGIVLAIDARSWHGQFFDIPIELQCKMCSLIAAGVKTRSLEMEFLVRRRMSTMRSRPSPGAKFAVHRSLVKIGHPIYARHKNFQQVSIVFTHRHYFLHAIPYA